MLRFQEEKAKELTRRREEMEIQQEMVRIRKEMEEERRRDREMREMYDCWLLSDRNSFKKIHTTQRNHKF